MTDTLLALLPIYGAFLLAIATLLSCLALPIPASVLMMAAGGFVLSGELLLWQVSGAALAGALIGDQIGFALGRSGAGFVGRIETKGGKQAKALRRATRFTRERGLWAVYFSRWLFSPLGPYVNVTAGAARMGWARFSLASLAGEATWVGLYIGIGAGAVDQFATLWPLVRDTLGFLAALCVAVLLALRLRWLLQGHRHRMPPQHKATGQ